MTPRPLPRIPSWLKSGVVRAKAALRPEKGLAAAYVYGSSLKRRRFEDVDVALLYLPGRRPSSERLTRLALALDKAFRAETDLHLADDLPDPLRFRVISDGFRFLAKEPLAAVRFEAETLDRFLDFKPAFDRVSEAILRRTP